MSDKKRGLEGGSDSSMLAAKGDLIDSMSSAEGLPVTCAPHVSPVNVVAVVACPKRPPRRSLGCLQGAHKTSKAAD